MKTYLFAFYFFLTLKIKATKNNHKNKENNLNKIIIIKLNSLSYKIICKHNIIL